MLHGPEFEAMTSYMVVRAANHTSRIIKLSTWTCFLPFDISSFICIDLNVNKHPTMRFCLTSFTRSSKKKKLRNIETRKKSEGRRNRNKETSNGIITQMNELSRVSGACCAYALAAIHTHGRQMRNAIS